MQKFGALQVESLLVTHPADWYYLTGFTGESGALVVTRRGTTLITDGRFVGQAKAETTGIAVVQQKSSLFEFTGEFLAGSKAKRVGFEATQLSVSQYGALRKAAGPAAPAELVPLAYPDVKPDLYALAERSLLAHLYKLVREGRALERDGRFSATGG